MPFIQQKINLEQNYCKHKFKTNLMRPNVDDIFYSDFTYIAGLHILKERFFLAVLFERFFFFADLKEKKGFSAR